MARTKEQNRRYYENRVRRARAEGFKGYGQKRRILAQAKSFEGTRQAEIDHLRAQFPDAVDYNENWEENFPDRARALVYLEERGVDVSDLQESEDFWAEVRPLLEKESP